MRGGVVVTLELDADLARALIDAASREGITPTTLARRALSERFLPSVRPIQARDEWEARLLALGKDCGGSPAPEAFTSDGLYE